MKKCEWVGLGDRSKILESESYSSDGVTPWRTVMGKSYTSLSPCASLDKDSINFRVEN